MRLLLADDHTLFRDTFVQYIERAKPGSKVYTAQNFDQALETIKRENNFDLVLLDLRMPGMHGLTGVEKLRQTHPSLRIALISGLAEEDDVKKAMSLGIAGYFPKTLSGQALIKALELVLTGERFIPIDHNNNGIMPAYRVDPQVSFFKPASSYGGMNEDQALFSTATKDSARLTPREREVLQYLARGESNKEIARALDLQVVTVKLHVRGICKKLDAANRTQAALKAQEMGLTGLRTDHHG
ncbi:MAG: response regulator transcription factor [Alphaproteobacteria bacterium]|nr:response regulator transcription factor [Alphaproteobacteria bacterium]